MIDYQHSSTTIQEFCAEPETSDSCAHDSEIDLKDGVHWAVIISTQVTECSGRRPSVLPRTGRTAVAEAGECTLPSPQPSDRNRVQEQPSAGSMPGYCGSDGSVDSDVVADVTLLDMYVSKDL
jgi:hypothetical protein